MNYVQVTVGMIVSVRPFPFNCNRVSMINIDRSIDGYGSHTL